MPRHRNHDLVTLLKIIHKPCFTNTSTLKVKLIEGYLVSLSSNAHLLDGSIQLHKDFNMEITVCFYSVTEQYLWLKVNFKSFQVQRATNYFLLSMLLFYTAPLSKSIFLHLKTVLFHDPFTLNPLLREPQLFIADFNSTHQAPISITTVWLQWYCDDKEKKCNKLPDWDNIMTPLHSSAEETLYSSPPI